MTFSLRTHEFTSRNGQSVASRTNPYVRLVEGQNPPIFAQAGQFFYEDGSVIAEADLPGWFKPLWERVGPEVREEVGFANAKAGRKPS